MENSIDIQDSNYLENCQDLEKPTSKRHQNASRQILGIQDITYILNSDTVDIDNNDIKPDLSTLQLDSSNQRRTSILAGRARSNCSNSSILEGYQIAPNCN